LIFLVVRLDLISILLHALDHGGVADAHHVRLLRSMVDTVGHLFLELRHNLAQIAHNTGVCESLLEELLHMQELVGDP
jgi:hypothetical protein